MIHNLRVILAGAVVLIGASSSAMAGSGNVLYLAQESDGGGGNQFGSNQAGATNSAIGSGPLAATVATFGSADAAATQRGAGNSADLTLTNFCPTLATDCGSVALLQDNSTATLSGLDPAVQGSLAGNRAHVTINGVGDASIEQIGDLNTASLTIGDGDGSITQTGLRNDATLEVTGNAIGSITQKGNFDAGKLVVDGTAGSDVALTQLGNQLSYGHGADTPLAVTVQTNGSVTITQTQM